VCSLMGKVRFMDEQFGRLPTQWLRGGLRRPCRMRSTYTTSSSIAKRIQFPGGSYQLEQKRRDQRTLNMSVIRRVARWAVALLIGFMVMGAVLAEMSMHAQRPPGLGGYPAGTPRVTAFDGVTLRGVFTGSGNRGCVLLLHGIGDTHFGMSGFSEGLVAGGYRALAPDSRGHGWSGDALVTYGVRESRDVSTWVDWLQSHGCTRIYGLGESLGGAVLLQSLARESRFQAVVADSAYASFPSDCRARRGRRPTVRTPALWRGFDYDVCRRVLAQDPHAGSAH
jgi:predicted alpha/beta-fold hydrolase